jgi:hypothetical protein
MPPNVEGSGVADFMDPDRIVIDAADLRATGPAWRKSRGQADSLPAEPSPGTRLRSKPEAIPAFARFSHRLARRYQLQRPATPLQVTPQQCRETSASTA